MHKMSQLVAGISLFQELKLWGTALLWSEPLASLHRPSCGHYPVPPLSWYFADVWNYKQNLWLDCRATMKCKRGWSLLFLVSESQKVSLSMCLSEDSGTIRCKDKKVNLWNDDEGRKYSRAEKRGMLHHITVVLLRSTWAGRPTADLMNLCKYFVHGRLSMVDGALLTKIANVAL